MFLSITSLKAGGHRTPAPDNAGVYFISPSNGDTLNGKVTIRFGLKGMGVAPAGIEKANTGHHHLLVDTGLPDLDFAVPIDENHIHFGGGQTEVTLTLAPGKHTLQLLLGDMGHVPHEPAVKSKVITITVK
jgi:hypothetical protein